MFNPYAPKTGEIAAAMEAYENRPRAIRCEAVGQEGQCDRAAGHPLRDPASIAAGQTRGRGHMTLTKAGPVVVFVW